jgi:hypothetical protein
MAKIFIFRKLSVPTVFLNLMVPWSILRHAVELPERVISSSQGLYLHKTTQHRKTKDKQPCPERYSNPRSSVRAFKVRPSLRLRGHWIGAKNKRTNENWVSERNTGCLGTSNYYFLSLFLQKYECETWSLTTNTDRGCSSTGCLEYLNLWGMEWQKGLEDCIMVSSIICTLHQTMKLNSMRWAGHVARIREDKCVQHFGWTACRKQTTRRRQA